MVRIGGNTVAMMQVKVTGSKNVIGEKVNDWLSVVQFTGFFDLMSSGTSGTSRVTYGVKLEESTHIFICDFRRFRCLSKQLQWNPFNFHESVTNLELEQDVDVTSENGRMLINGKLYDIMMIDDPMNLHQHLEIYLKFTGGQ